MAEIKETVTTTRDESETDTGEQPQQPVQKMEPRALDTKSTAANAVWYVVGAIVILLGFRFVLKLFGANPSSGFVEFVYAISGILSGPFDNIFGVTTASTGTVSSVFEPSILVAAVVYALIGWGIVQLMNLNRAT